MSIPNSGVEVEVPHARIKEESRKVQTFDSVPSWCQLREVRRRPFELQKQTQRQFWGPRCTYVFLILSMQAVMAPYRTPPIQSDEQQL